jgi:hypothetical protein
VVFNATLNHRVRMLDGQWQGVHMASDGKVYFFGGSHSAGVSAPFFRYDPARNDSATSAHDIEIIAQDMTRICGEDPTKTPTQGKVHSDIMEHNGWLYFGTHLSDYTPAGCHAYTGGHLVGYELATGKFRDYGVIHPNFTNYSAVAVDRLRNHAYFYATPFGKGDGPHLHRIDLATGENKDLGLVAPWNGKGHGQPCQHMFVDPRGDCWFTVRGEHALFVARYDSGKIERYDGMLPGNAPQWYCQRDLPNPEQTLVIFPDGFYIFDASQFGSADGPFKLLKKVNTPGLHWSYFAVDDKRFYWNSRTQEHLPTTGQHETRIWSSSLTNPSETIDHGPIRDAQGRGPWFIGDMVTDRKGRLYTAGRWYVLPEEVPTIGVNRNGLLCAVFFTVLDVSQDLPG